MAIVTNLLRFPDLVSHFCDVILLCTSRFTLSRIVIQGHQQQDKCDWLTRKLNHNFVKIGKAFNSGRQDHGGTWLFPWIWIHRLDRHISFAARDSRSMQISQKIKNTSMELQSDQRIYCSTRAMKSLEAFGGYLAMKTKTLLFMGQSNYTLDKIIDTLKVRQK